MENMSKNQSSKNIQLLYNPDNIKKHVCVYRWIGMYVCVTQQAVDFIILSYSALLSICSTYVLPYWQWFMTLHTSFCYQSKCKWLTVTKAAKSHITSEHASNPSFLLQIIFDIIFNMFMFSYMGFDPVENLWALYKL